MCNLNRKIRLRACVRRFMDVFIVIHGLEVRRTALVFYITYKGGMNVEDVRQENKMGTMSEGKLLMNMSLPMMISMLVQAMYNIVDSVFVSRVSENALTAVSLAFPLQTLLIAVAGGTGVGVNSLLSKSLGEKNFDRANKTATNGIFLYIVSYLVSAVVGLLAVRPFYASQIGDAPVEIMDMACSI